MTIFNIRGTNGSGKSTVVLQLMDHYDTTVPVMGMRPDRKSETIIGYICKHKLLGDLFVFGPYKTPCGGCDTFSWKGSYPWMFEQIQKFHDKYGNVIYEGMTLSTDKNWVTKLMESEYPVEVIFLETTLEECYTAINKRRAQRNKGVLENTTNVDRKFKDIKSKRDKLTANNVSWCEKNRAVAADYILDVLQK